MTSDGRTTPLLWHCFGTPIATMLSVLRIDPHSVPVREMSRLATLVAATAVLALNGCSDATTTPPPPIPQLSIASGDKQQAEAGTPLTHPLTVTVATPAGDPLQGQTVAWTVVSGNGSVSATSVVSDAAGHASVKWTLGDLVGEQRVQATVLTFAVQFSATAAASAVLVPIILHYDGNGWTTARQSSINYPVALNAIWGASATAIFAVGSDCGGGIVLTYDGSAWTPPPPACVAPPSTLTAIWGNAASDVFTLGKKSFGPSSTASILHLDSQGWTNQYLRDCSSCDPFLNGGWSSSPTDAVAIGDSGIVLHYTGTNWATQSSGTVQNLNAVFGFGATDIFAVGNAGTILHYDGNSWQPQTSGTSQPLYAVWGTSTANLFAAGGNGIILHYDGSAWSAQNSGTTTTLRGLWGNAGSSVFAVGDASTILHYDGATWTPQATTASMDLRGVWGTSASNVIAVGAPR